MAGHISTQDVKARKHRPPCPLALETKAPNGVRKFSDTTQIPLIFVGRTLCSLSQQLPRPAPAAQLASFLQLTQWKVPRNEEGQD